MTKSRSVLLGAVLVAALALTGCGGNDDTSAPPPSTPTTAPTTPTSSAPAKLGAQVTLTPTVKGRVMTMKITVAGTAVVPIGADDQATLPDGTSFVDISLGSDYDFGDGSEPSGSDGGGVVCQGATKVQTGSQTYEPAEAHTYAKPGTYTFSYKIRFCGEQGKEFTAAKSADIVVK